MLLICEATGGYEDAVLKAASELGASIVTSPMDRACAPTPNSEAGTPRAIPSMPVLIAEYGRDKPDLRLYQPPRPEEAALRALMGRRAELKDMIQAETCRLEHASQRGVSVDLENHLAAFKNKLALIEKGNPRAQPLATRRSTTKAASCKRSLASGP